MIVVIAVVVVIGFIGLTVTVNQVGRRQARTEAKLDRIIAHLDIPAPDSGSLDRVQELVDKGLIIEAIKQHRQDTGSGLREAKFAVERMAKRS